MNILSNSSTFKDRFVKLSKNNMNKAEVYEFLAQFGETLQAPLTTILNAIPTLQQKNLTAEQQQCTNTIYQATIQMLSLVNDAVQLNQKTAQIPNGTNKLEGTQGQEQADQLKALNNVKTLVITEEGPGKNKLLKRLKDLGLNCTVTNLENALQILYAAQTSGEPFQIAVMNAKQYEHHIAYLGRTIKSNAHLGHVMTCLSLSSELLTFEKEQAHFDGFACILNLSKPESFARKLANSWRGWAAKMSFDYTKPDKVKNRILLVEDDPIPQKVTQWQLSELGYTIDTAPDGHTALKLLEQNAYDLIFMDIGLPDISGLDITAEIRKREEGGHHVPIIGLTIYALESDEKTGLQAGMDEYLVKPVMPDRLKSVLDRWVKN